MALADGVYRVGVTLNIHGGDYKLTTCDAAVKNGVATVILKYARDGRTPVLTRSAQREHFEPFARRGGELFPGASLLLNQPIWVTAQEQRILSAP